MEADNKSLMELPKDIVEAVLVRLPLQVLLVCCCVSKTLFNLILSDFSFAKTLFARSKPQLMIPCPEGTNFHLIDLDADENPRLGEPVEIKPSFNLPPHGFEVTHSCNGLVLLESLNLPEELHCCMVCNPVTGEYTMLPETAHLTRNVNCAFFVCPLTNRFKVLRTFHHIFHLERIWDLDFFRELNPSLHFDSDVELDLFFDHDNNLDLDTKIKEPYVSSAKESDAERVTMAQLLVGGSDSWMSLGNLPFSPLSIYSPCYLDKATHWLCGDASVLNLVVFFNFESQCFGEIPAPAHMGKDRTYLSLVVLGGNLSIFDSFVPNGKFDIWVMKEYGVADSWTNDFVIDTTIWGLNYLHFDYKPTICRANGEVVMVDDDGVILVYHLFEKRGEVFLHSSLGSTFRALVHTPSFMSLRDFMRDSNMEVLNVASRFAQENSHHYLHLLSIFSELAD